MKYPTMLAGAAALLAALTSPAFACESGTLAQAANAHGLGAPYAPAAGAAAYGCPAAPAASASVSSSRPISLAAASTERRGRGRSGGLHPRGPRSR